MIVDTSALIAVFQAEPGFEAIETALLSGGGIIPAPVLVEFARVASTATNEPHPGAEQFLRLVRRKNRVEPFTPEDADEAVVANPSFGTGNRRGGTLNLLDLMVFGMARRTGLPILCTGRDFAATGISLHPASRLN